MTCPGCGGVVGQDCWNPQECEWISRDMEARQTVEMQQQAANTTSESFRQRLSDHLTGLQERWTETSARRQIVAEDIKDFHVRWDEGGEEDHSDSPPRPPSLEVSVKLTDGKWFDADPGWVIANLLRMAVGMEPR